MVDKYIMKTYQERLESLREMLRDPDLELELKEVVSHLYHWYMYERAVQLEKKAHHLMRKHGKALNDNIDVFSLRKRIKSL